MSFPRYPRYKEIGAEWLAEVPEHWQVKRLKHIVRLLTDKTDRRDNPVGLEHIESWTGRYVASDTEFQGDGTSFDKGDILFGKLRPYLAKVLLADAPGEAVGDFHVLRPKSGVASEFLQFAVLSREFIDIVNGSTFGSKMPRASWEFMGGLPVPLPTPTEQSLIAAFLDRETAKIDALVAEQQRLMDLLQEKRQTTISDAVTKGLNPNAPMKASGFDWLGELPTHWDVLRIKSLCTLISKGTTPMTVGAEFASEGVRFLKAENITENGVEDRPEFFISEEVHGILSRSSLENADVLVVIAGATTGKSAVMRKELLPANTNQAVSFLRPVNKNHSAYISLWLGTRSVRHRILMTSVQSAQPNLSMEDLGNIPIPLPPPAELQRVLVFVSNAVAKVDALGGEARRAIDLLQERRAALISAAVTGQIDVRGLVESVAA